MTTWIGQFGSMRPTPCVTASPTTHEERTIFSGGAGTLAPRRVLHLGGPATARQWSPSVGPSGTHDMSPVVQLAHAQRILGQGWRVVPCDAVKANMFTEGASEAFVGWTLAGGGPLAIVPVTQHAYENEYTVRRVEEPTGYTSILEPGVTLQAGVTLGPEFDVIYEITDVTTRIVYPSLGLSHGVAAYTPDVPLLGEGPWDIHIGAFHTGTATVRVRAMDAAGTVVWSNNNETTHGTQLRATKRALTVTDPTAVKLDLAIVPNSGVILSCWPSIHQGTQPGLYTPGRGCDEAWLSVPNFDPYMTTDRDHYSSWSYTITEIGV